jgi:hypothetical protein
MIEIVIIRFINKMPIRQSQNLARKIPNSKAASELENHNKSGAGLKIIVGYLHLVVELLASENETNLRYFDALSLL